MPRHLPYRKTNTPKAQNLRKELTPAERKLWYDFLSKQPVRWLKQRPIGDYIADFYCASAKLVVEVDGGQHFSEEGLAYDAQRTAYLQSLGLRVIRFSNAEVMGNFEGVCGEVERWVKG